MWKNFLKGIIRENPVLVLLLGTCPTLAVTTSVSSAFGMGIAFTAVLLGSNIVISAMRRMIPGQVRIPCYIVIIAGFVTAVEMIMHAFAPDLYEALGVFLSLIVVNCIILGRAEVYASKNRVLDSAVDALGMGVGFTLALLAMASIREIFGAGSFMGWEIPILSKFAVPILINSPGGFFVFGILIAIVNCITKRKTGRDFGCTGCPSAAVCGANDGSLKKAAEKDRTAGSGKDSNDTAQEGGK